MAEVRVWSVVDLSMHGTELARQATHQALAGKIAADLGLDFVKNSDWGFIDYYIVASSAQAEELLRTLAREGVEHGAVDLIGFADDDPFVEQMRELTGQDICVLPD